MNTTFQHFVARYSFVFLISLFLLAKFISLVLSNLALPALVTLLCIGGIIYAFNRKHRYIQRSFFSVSAAVNKINPLYVFALILTIHLVVRFIAIPIFQVDTSVGYDQMAYIPGSTELLEKGYLEKHAAYLYQAPHFFWFAHFLALPISIFGESNTGILLYQALISTASSYFLGATLYQQYNRMTSYMFMLVYALMPGTVLSCSHLTHEHALLFFLSIFIWLRWFLVPKLTRKPIIQFCVELLSYAVLIFSSLVNGSGFIAIIAAAIAIFTERGRTTFTKAAVFGILMLLFVTIRHGANDYHIRHTHCDVLPSQIEQYKWVLYIGSCAISSGHYVAAEHSHFFYDAPKSATSEEIAAYHNNLLKDRYEDLADHPKKLISLLSRKLMVIWGVFGMPYGVLAESSTNPFYRAATTLMALKIFKYLESMLLLIIGLYAVIRGKRSEDSFYIWCTLFLCGVTCMLLITEVSGKYTYPFQPFLYMIFLIPCLGNRLSCKDKE